MIINSDQDSLLIIQESKLIIRNLNEYNILKYKDYNGKRIFVKIGNIDIQETYNNGIFNIIVSKDGKEKLTFQEHNSIELCKRILFNDEKRLIEFFQKHKAKDIDQQFLIKSLQAFYKFLKFNNEGVIINKIFKVDKNGQAYFLKRKEWKRLCIVAENSKKFKMFLDLGLGDQEVNFQTVEILHKVLFLLNPNCEDSIFMNQLPNEIKKEIVKNEFD